MDKKQERTAGAIGGAVGGAVGGFLVARSGNVIVGSIITGAICAAIAVIVCLTVGYYWKCQKTRKNNK